MGVKLEDADIIRIEEVDGKKIYVHRCKVCGTEMRARGDRLRKYCQKCGVKWKCERDRCRYGIAKRGRYQRRIRTRKTIKPKISIEEINAAARAAGMSYGAWVALHEQL